MTPAESSPRTWNEWGIHVLEELKNGRADREKLRDEIAKIRTEDIPELKTEIAMLKVKSSLWGAAGSAIIILITKLFPLLAK